MILNEKALAVILSLTEGRSGRAEKLLDYLPEEAAESVRRLVNRQGVKGRSKNLLSEMRQSGGVNRLVMINDIHPFWLLEVLRGESPRVIGLLCRLLSGEKARYLISQLSGNARRQLPAISQTYAVPAEIFELIREVLERRLALNRLPEQGDNFGFFHLGWMKKEDLTVLMRDLGIEEIRRAFHEVTPQTLRLFLSRFSLDEVRQIRNRLNHGSMVPPQERQRAQQHLLSLNLDHLNPEGLLQEIGFSVFSKAVLPEDLEWARTVYMKLPPDEGHRLHRVLCLQVSENHPATMKPARDLILERVLVLGSTGKIRRYWKDPEEMEKTVSFNAA